MDCEPESPLNAPLPRTAEERTTELEEAVNRIHISFKKEVSRLHRTLADMDATHRAEMEEAGRARAGHGHGNFHQGQANFEGRDPVKAIGDVRRTMHAICQIPKLSHATLSDFDQWEARDVQHNRICSHRRPKIQPSEHRVHLRFHRPRSQGSSGGTSNPLD